MVFAREVEQRAAEDPRVQALEAEAGGGPGEAARLRARLRS